MANYDAVNFFIKTAIRVFGQYPDNHLADIQFGECVGNRIYKQMADALIFIFF